LFNAVLGNVLGVFVSPALISAYVGSTSGLPFDYSQVFIDLSITIVGPLILGQIIQYFFRKQLTIVQSKISLPITSSVLLLILVWSVFCDLFSARIEVNSLSILAILALDVALFLLFTSLSFGITIIPILNYEKGDTIAIVMCSATKTVALGIPMINIIYGHTPESGILIIPLLIYHAQQLVCH